MKKGIDWDKILEDAYKAHATKEAIRETLNQEIIYLSQIAKELAMEENVLRNFAAGEKIDDRNKKKLILWFTKYQELKTDDPELKRLYRTAFLAAKLSFYGTDEQLDKFADELKKRYNIE